MRLEPGLVDESRVAARAIGSLLGHRFQQEIKAFCESELEGNALSSGR